MNTQTMNSAQKSIKFPITEIPNYYEGGAMYTDLYLNIHPKLYL